MTAFARHARASDGHRHDCRECIADGKAKRARDLSEDQRRKDKARRAKPHRRKANRRAVAAWQERNPNAVAAKKQLRKAVKSGRVEKAIACQVDGCDAVKVEAHHHSYEKPLDVLWTCPKHHRRMHSGIRFALKAGIPIEFADIPETW